MTHFPQYLKDYPNRHTSMPLSIKINRLSGGYPAHRHDFLEFSYVLSGSGSEMINGVMHVMRPGIFTFILPFQIHELFTDPGEDLVLCNCMFSMDLLMGACAGQELLGLLTSGEELSPYAQLTGAEQQRMDGHMKEMLQEFAGDELWRDALLRSHLTEALVRFDRSRRRSHAAAPGTLLFPAGINPTWQILHYIQCSYQEPLTLAHLAAKFSISMSRISERIKETTGQTFVQFVNDLRLRHACSLLLSTEMSVAEIAYDIGFGSYKTFSKQFKEHKGIVPTEYRKLHAAMPG